MNVHLKLAFELGTLRIALSSIRPLKHISERAKKSIKYNQIAASIREVGIIEPPIVTRDAQDPDTYHLLDGHCRVAILSDEGYKEVVCIVATDDEAYTYNKRINRLTTIQEHKMILNAVRKGVPEERLARALNVNIASVHGRQKLLDGICHEAASLLEDRHVPLQTFTQLRKLKPIRQIEAAELMIAMNRYSIRYAQSIVAATPDDQLIKSNLRLALGLTADQLARVESEAAKMQRDFRAIEKDYGSDNLDLVLAVGYLSRLLSNAKIVGYLAQRHSEILSEFQKIATPHGSTNVSGFGC